MAETAEMTVSQSGGKKPKMKVLSGLVPPEAVRGESVPGFPPVFWWFAGIPWLADLCLYPHMTFSLCAHLSPNFSFSKDTVILNKGLTLLQCDFTSQCA